MTDQAANALGRCEIDRETVRERLNELCARIGIPRAAAVLGVHTNAIRKWKAGHPGYGPCRLARHWLSAVHMMTDEQLARLMFDPEAKPAPKRKR